MLTYCNSIVFWQLDFVSCNHAIRNGFTLFYISLLMVLLEVLLIFDEVDYVRLIIRCYFRSIIFYIFQLFFLTLA